MGIEKGRECKASNRTLTFSTTQTAKLSAVCAVPTLSPRKYLGTHLEAERTEGLGHLEIF